MKPSEVSGNSLLKVMTRKIVNLSKKTIIAQDAKLAGSFFLRLKGLLGEESIESGGGLIIQPCDSIHTFFMRFAIDAAFVDKNNRIVKIYSHLRPWRLSGVFFNSAFCIELPAGVLAATNTHEGDLIQLDICPIYL